MVNTVVILATLFQVSRKIELRLELTKEGSKPIEQFGYGLQHGKVGHTRHEWISAHLKNPKIWDEGLPKPFKDLNRMPNFYLNDSEIDAMVTAILGQVSDPIPLKVKIY